MKLLRFGPEGQEKPGLLDAEGQIRDLSALLDDYTPRLLGREALRALAAIDPARLPLVKGPVRIGMPWSGMSKFVAIGLNYRDHAEEAGMPIPKEPILFAKWPSCACGPDDDIPLPEGSTRMDWEVELGIVIGERARNVSVADALEHVAGYCLANDVSEREYQIDRSGGQWSKGKGFDRFGPIGPWLVTRDEVPDPQALQLWLDVNGERRQSGSTRTMIFGCAELISHCSRVMTLEPGDLIITGTPPGVGMGMKPPRYLKAGDVMELGIEGLGVQRQRVA
ncbi:fumarylacetoacetate hydrolase family protein [Delftia sp. NA_296.1]|uniref:fumarylacetoacetate hydrolase family protein n=1 Tax=Delftia sp. NA_296.1 TaxID=3415648 RepID=UPI004045D902